MIEDKKLSLNRTIIGLKQNIFADNTDVRFLFESNYYRIETIHNDGKKDRARLFESNYYRIETQEVINT